MVDMYQRHRESCRFHLQRVRRRQDFSLKQWHLSSKLHGVMSQRMKISVLKLFGSWTL